MDAEDTVCHESPRRDKVKKRGTEIDFDSSSLTSERERQLRFSHPPLVKMPSNTYLDYLRNRSKLGGKKTLNS